jgi:hypothetical protein
MERTVVTFYLLSFALLCPISLGILQGQSMIYQDGNNGLRFVTSLFILMALSL